MDVPAPGPAPIFSGFFIDWPSVCEAAKHSELASNSTEAFNTDRWMTRQREMLASARAGEYPRPTNLPLLASICNPEYIVDLGGGADGLQNFYQSRTPTRIEVI